MNLRNIVHHLLERLTFGLRIHYLLKVLILQFGTLFLAFQFTNQRTIPIVNETAFEVAYLLISAFLLVIVGVLIKDMHFRTFSSELHNQRSILFSIILYTGSSFLIVIFGFISLIIASDGISGINQFDVIAGMFFTTIFAALLTVGYHDQLESMDHPTKSVIQDSISKWQQYQSWVKCEEGSQTKEKKRESFDCACEDLLGLLQHANTKEGEQLCSDFDSWWNKYKSHEPIGKEMIISGQDKEDLKNDELECERQSFLSLEEKMNKLLLQNK